MRIAIAAAITCLSMAGLTATAQVHAAIRQHTEIPAESLDLALRTLAKDRGFQLVYLTENVASLKTGGAAGDLTIDEALKTLLSDSRLEYKFVDDKTISIFPKGNRTSALGSNEIQSDQQTQDSSGSLSKSTTAAIRLAQLDQAKNAGASSVVTPSARPQENPSASSPGLTEIIVTAQKRNERLQDVPIPVTAVSAEALVETNQTRLQDYYSTIPGLNISPAPGAGGEQMLSIRGISTGYNTNPTVGITVDDVPYGSSSALQGNTIPDIDPADLARVEVLRGPQGTLYGASSMGGLIKFVTLDPSTDALTGRIQAGTSSVYNGTDLGYNVRGSINVPLSDTLAIRASGFSREDPGYIDNPVLGIDGVNKASAYGGRIAALWRPSDVFSIKLSALYQDLHGDGSNDVDRAINGYTGPALGNLQQTYIANVGGYDRSTQAYSAYITGKLGGLNITSVTGYNINQEKDSFDYTYLFGSLTKSVFGVTGTPLDTRGTTDKFTQEIRLTAPIGQTVDWLLGGFFTLEHSNFAQGAAAQTPSGQQLGYLIYLGPDPSTFKESAAFTDVTFHITDQFDLQVGARESQIRQTAGPEPESGALEPPGAVEAEEYSKTNAFTYLLTPQFKLSPDLMIYARFASGYRAGGPNQNPDATVPRQYSPDKTENYELGTKGDFLNHTFSVDASLYYIDWKSLQINLLDSTDGITYTTNGGRAKSQGIELSAEARPLTGLKVAAWIVWNDAVLTQSFPVTSAVAGVDGDRLPYSSRFSSTLSLDQDFPITQGITGFVGGTASYVGDRVGTFISTVPRQVYPGYTRVDLHAGARYSSWTTNLYVTNLSNARGELGGGLGAYPPYGFSIIQPRTVGLSITHTF